MNLRVRDLRERQEKEGEKLGRETTERDWRKANHRLISNGIKSNID